MQKHFVEFLSPGSFVHETTLKPIDGWDVSEATKMAKEILERHNAKPFAFRFVTRERGEDDLDSKVSDTSGIYYLGGTIETLEQIKAKGNGEDRILIRNMECNGWDKVITNTNSWKVTQPFTKYDTLLEIS